MGIFDFLKKIEPMKCDKSDTVERETYLEDQQSSINYTVYYAYGHIVRALPPLRGYYENREIINAATSIVSDGKAYNLADIHSIYSIPVPSFHSHVESRIGREMGITGNLDYVLRMKASLYWNNKDFDLSIACLEKATQIMASSDIEWPKNDFYRVVNWLRDLGCLERANAWKKWIEKTIPDPVKETINNTFSSCKSFGTDLVEVGDSGVCCEICAKYRNRIYSLSGRNRRFPKFPKDFHYDCGLSVWPFVAGVNEPSFSCADYIQYSNRPFVDDRTPEELKNREKWLEDLRKRPSFDYQPDAWRIAYHRLCKLLPDDVPKSMGGFTRMRNANSKKFQLLVQKAKDIGFEFPQSSDDLYDFETEWDFSKMTIPFC